MIEEINNGIWSMPAFVCSFCKITLRTFLIISAGRLYPLPVTLHQSNSFSIFVDLMWGRWSTAASAHADVCARTCSSAPESSCMCATCTRVKVCVFHMSPTPAWCGSVLPTRQLLGPLLSLLRNHPFCGSNQSCASRSPAKPLILGLLESCFN